MNKGARNCWSDPVPSGPTKKKKKEPHQTKLIKIKRKKNTQQRMIKSLVSPREEVFRFPFQLEADWSFSGEVSCEIWIIYARSQSLADLFLSSGLRPGFFMGC